VAAPDKVLELIERFDYNLSSYRSGKYNETQVRREFIDPFFEALGWDVDNKQGYAEAYKDVIHEDAIKIGGQTKAPDYSFRIGGTRKFFLEAKKPAVNLKDDIDPAFQIRRYAWSAKLPLSILTDFEELAVYDCRIQPNPTDKAATARVQYMTFRDYAERWDELAGVFSREAILKGSFDKYASDTKSKRGTAEVDDAFLKEIEGWRELLAQNIALRNPTLTQRELNTAVQKTIDRIIFLRICEDRGIEPYGILGEVADSKNIYTRLGGIFQRADDRYNSGLFHFKQEKNRAEEPDSFTLGLSIDDKPLKEILKGLYYPISPYEFSVLPADILGQVYEQFLGKVIVLDAKHKATVEEKPEVKKAGGVYYTPTYIVDYIVQNTVGKLLEGKTPNQIAAQGKTPPLRVLDPACGSGSFLIGAYQYLLDWHLTWYSENDPEKHAKGRSPRLYQGKAQAWRLTTDERKRILLTHIYGVDIDAQAVEVTKLSLLLKMLEGENNDSLVTQTALFQTRVLPDLESNIKSGNSLIGSDFYDNAQVNMFDEEERYRINVFDWEDEFAQVFADGGFDAVIGNPPYDIKGLPKTDVEYLFKKYVTTNNRINLFGVFIEKSLGLLSKKGRFSFIVPTSLLTQDSYKTLRTSVLVNRDIASLVRLPNESFGAVAGDVKVDTVIFVFSNERVASSLTEVIGYGGYARINKIDRKESLINGLIDQQTWLETEDNVWALDRTLEDEQILSKCEIHSIPLESCVDFSLGLTPYDKYRGHTPEQIQSRAFHADYAKDSTYKKLLAGNDVRRYSVAWNGSEWISYGQWLGAPREQRFFTEKRILVKQIIDWTTKRIWAALTEDELYNTQNAFNLLPKSIYSHEYLLGIINSKLMTFYHRKKFLDGFKMRFQKILIRDCKRFPIAALDFSKSSQRALHDEISKKVANLVELTKRRSLAQVSQERKILDRQSMALDRQIDQLVYKLHNLTPEEVATIEATDRHV